MEIKSLGDLFNWVSNLILSVLFLSLLFYTLVRSVTYFRNRSDKNKIMAVKSILVLLFISVLAYLASVPLATTYQGILEPNFKILIIYSLGSAFYSIFEFDSFIINAFILFSYPLLIVLLSFLLSKLIIRFYLKKRA